MTKNPKLLFDYLDAEWNYSEWNQKYKNVKQQYSIISAQKRNLEIQLQEKRKLEALLRDVKGKLAVFENAEVKDIFSKRQRLAEDKKIVKKVYSDYNRIIDIYKEWKELKIIDSVEKSELDEINQKSLAEWIDKLCSLKKRLTVLLVNFKSI